MKNTALNISNTVICDICDKDYSTSNKKGGFIFATNAVCPTCVPALLRDIKMFGESNYIKAFCPADMSFKDFILKRRESKKSLQISPKLHDKGLRESSNT